MCLFVVNLTMAYLQFLIILLVDCGSRTHLKNRVCQRIPRRENAKKLTLSVIDFLKDFVYTLSGRLGLTTLVTENNLAKRGIHLLRGSSQLKIAKAQYFGIAGGYQR